MKHTLGPWTNLASASKLTVTDSEHNPICIVLDHFTDPSENLSNARLIAAAPDLLEACKLLVRELQIFQASSIFLKDIELNSITKGIAAIMQADGSVISDCTKPTISKAEGVEP